MDSDVSMVPCFNAICNAHGLTPPPSYLRLVQLRKAVRFCTSNACWNWCSEIEFYPLICHLYYGSSIPRLLGANASVAIRILSIDLLGGEHIMRWSSHRNLSQQIRLLVRSILVRGIEIYEFNSTLMHVKCKIHYSQKKRTRLALQFFHQWLRKKYRNHFIKISIHKFLSANKQDSRWSQDSENISPIFFK